MNGFSCPLLPTSFDLPFFFLTSDTSCSLGEKFNSKYILFQGLLSIKSDFTVLNLQTAKKYWQLEKR